MAARQERSRSASAQTAQLIKTDKAALGKSRYKLKNLGWAFFVYSAAVAAASAYFSSASAYELTTPCKSGHFALHQVILERYENYDEELRQDLTRDLQVQNRMNKLYQSSAAIFPYQSKGLKGTIGESMLGLLSISNYATGEDQITLVNANTASYAGLYFSFAQLKDFVCQVNIKTDTLKHKNRQLGIERLYIKTDS